jgi:hypothetical protein
MHVNRAYGGVDLELHSFLTSALDRSECSESRLDRFTLRVISPVTQTIGGYVNPTDGLGAWEMRQFLGPGGNRT